MKNVLGYICAVFLLCSFFLPAVVLNMYFEEELFTGVVISIIGILYFFCREDCYIVMYVADLIYWAIGFIFIDRKNIIFLVFYCLSFIGNLCVVYKDNETVENEKFKKEKEKINRLSKFYRFSEFVTIDMRYDNIIRIDSSVISIYNDDEILNVIPHDRIIEDHSGLGILLNLEGLSYSAREKIEEDLKALYLKRRKEYRMNVLQDYERFPKDDEDEENN